MSGPEQAPESGSATVKPRSAAADIPTPADIPTASDIPTAADASAVPEAPIEPSTAALPTAAPTLSAAVRSAEDSLAPSPIGETEAPFVPRPGTPAAEPAVQAARADAEAARVALGIEIGRLRDAGRDAIDVKAKIKGMPAAIAREPAKFLGLGAAGAGAGVLMSRLRRGRKKPMPPGLLPAEVEAALEGVGPDADKVREALNSGFTRYLESQGAQARKGRRLPGAITLFVLPVAATAAREAIKRAFSQARKP